ncbi:hypothetical protein HMPREF9413_3243 [Paenibacillus sp. HGF7]|nr:hypothetical protein HMPREF9413_3243 [Paenibacillus sp. HGF7]
MHEKIAIPMNQTPVGIEKYPLFLVYVGRFGRYFYQLE